MSARGTSGRVVLVQTTVASYQHDALDLLHDRLSGRLLVLTGREYFDATIRSSYDRAWTVFVRNAFFGRRRFLWQGGVLAPGIAAAVVICELNPRIASTWVLLWVRRLCRRPTILWGHAFPRGGIGQRSDVVRGLMRRSAVATIVYSDDEAAELERLQPRLRVVAAPNALYGRSVMRAVVAGMDEPSAFVSVGRLVEEKRPELLVSAFLSVLPELPSGTRLLVVGDGPLRPRLEALAAESGGSVEILGAVTDIEELRMLYARSVAAVASGTVGLSIMQSLAFGVPLIYADDERHGPEIGLAVEGWNAVSFRAGSADDLAARFVELARDSAKWRDRREAIVEFAQRTTSIEGMIDRVLDTVLSLEPSSNLGLDAR